MIIKSYLVYPLQGKRIELEQDLRSTPGCEVIPATNQELLILVTESAHEKAESDLVSRLQNLTTLQALTLVSGHNELVSGHNELVSGHTEPGSGHTESINTIELVLAA